jgi:predicted nucleic acid-binding protein
VIVLDSSCLAEVLLQTDAAAAIETQLRRAGGLHAPELLDLEILQVLRRLLAGREISSERAEIALAALERLALRRWPHGPLRRRIWALRANLTAYDAAYVALAERLRCPVLTRDRKLARSSGHRVRIEVI